MSARLGALLVSALSVVAAIPCGFAQMVSTAALSGTAEVPPNASGATGVATITYFPATTTMTVSASFSGLSGTVVAAHIHCCTTGVANAGVATQTPTFTGFPAGVTSGTYEHTFDMTDSNSYNSAFVTASGSVAAALQRLLAGMQNGTAYFNIHTTIFPGGEIRGNLIVPALFHDGFE